MLTFKFILNTLCCRYKHPKYWPLLGGVFLVKLMVVLLPGRCLFILGQGLGWSGYRLAKRRRAIALRNIQACFPKLSAKEHQALVYQHFMSLGRGVMETCVAWFMPYKRFDRLVQVKMVGEAYLEQARKLRGQRGIIFLGPHLTGMEVVGRYLGERFQPDLVYQKHNNPLFEAIVCEGRNFARELIERREIRKMVRSLKEGYPVWYFPDQDFGPKVSVFAPFFGVPCATVRGLSWLCKMADPLIIPGAYKCLPGIFHYEVQLGPFLKNIPSGDDLQDAILYNQWLEGVIQNNLPDYFWVHRRFKNRPPGEPEFYIF